MSDAALRIATDAIRDVIEGNYDMDRSHPYRDDKVPSKLDQCRHGNRHYEGCENCIDEFLLKALARIEELSG